MANMTTRRLKREYREHAEIFHKGLVPCILGNRGDSLFFDRGMEIIRGDELHVHCVRYCTWDVLYLSKRTSAKRGKRTGPWLG